jgi:c-di-GMP-binding flagellar brake protein YcgR
MVADLPGVRIGANCEIAIESPDGYGEYKSRIEDMDGDRLTLAMPSLRGAYVIPSMDDLLQVILPTSGGGSLFMEGEVVGRQTQPYPMIVMRVLGVGQQQSRGFFRVNVVLRPTDCAVWDRTGGTDEAFWRPVRASVQDMSGGGIGMLADEDIPQGTRMRVRFPLPYGGGECIGTGEVKMCRPHRGSSRSPRWILGLQLDQMARRERERLIKGVHRFQAEERRIGAL